MDTVFTFVDLGIKTIEDNFDYLKHKKILAWKVQNNWAVSNSVFIVFKENTN